MGKVQAAPSDSAGYSYEYFRLRGRLMTIESNAKHGDVEQDLSQFRSSVYEAYERGELTILQCEELMTLADKVTSTATWSEEYLRLKQRHAMLTENGRIMNSAEREDFNDEIDLALQSNLISQEEADKLRDLPASMVNNDIIGSKVINIPRKRRASDAPMRKKAAEKRNEHTPRYYELVDEYRALYTPEASAHMESLVRKFFRDVDVAYKNDAISMSEYREFQLTLNDTQAFLSEATVPTEGADFEFLRERVIASVSSDEALTEIVKQVASWAKTRGVPENLVKSNPLGVALSYFEEYLAAGEQLVAVGEKVADRRQLLQMRL